MHVSSDLDSPMLRPSNGPKAIEIRMFSSACLALPCTECTQGSPDPSVDRFKPTTVLYGMPGGPCVHSVQGKARQADENIRISIALGPFDGRSMGRIQI